MLYYDSWLLGDDLELMNVLILQKYIGARGLE